MATPPSVKRFYGEDYKDAPAWFRTKFLNTLNLFSFPVYTALNGDIDASNLNIQYYTFSIAGSATATSNVVSFKTTISGTVHGVSLMSAVITGAATPTFLTTAPAVASWTVSGNEITIQSITGLSNSTTYNITIKVE